MSVQWVGAFGILGLFALLFFRIPVWAALVIAGLVGNTVINGWPAAFATLGTTPFDVANSYPLSVIPLFILMGDVASSTRLSADLFNAARVLLSGVRGGLAVAAPVQLVHPPEFDPTALAAVRDFLVALGCTVRVEQDPIVPMLMKNQLHG